MLINQTLELVLVRLYSSSVMVVKLSIAEGLDCDHINFSRGRSRMIVKNDIAAFTMRFGAFVYAKAEP